MWIHKYHQYIKDNRIKKAFLKDKVTGRKAQTQRENCIIEALCDVLIAKPDASEGELFAVAKHVDRVVNSEWMRSEWEKGHGNKSRFHNAREPFVALHIDPCAYKLDKRKTVQGSKPFTNWAYWYIIKQILKEIEQEE